MRYLKVLNALTLVALVVVSVVLWQTRREAAKLRQEVARLDRLMVVTEREVIANVMMDMAVGTGSEVDAPAVRAVGHSLAAEYRAAGEQRIVVRSAEQRQQPATSGARIIKGNISASGERIYHVPGQRFYDKTRIEEWKGECWFATEEEAQAAGWRRSKR